MSDHQHVAVLGTGRMGATLATTLLEHGHTVHAWNRTAAKLAPLAARGARPAASPVEAIQAAAVVIVNVRDYAASDEWLRAGEAPQALRGKLLVQLSSGSPGRAREAAAWAAQHGIDYLDGAIMATPDIIGTPDGTLLYSGPRALFERHRALLLAMGGNTQHVGDDPGHAATLDAALLVQMWGAGFGALQGFAICQAEGLPATDFAAQLRAIAPVVQSVVDDLSDRIAQQRLTADATTQASLDTHYAAFRQLLALHEERRLDDALPRAMERLFQAAIQAGHGADEFAMLSRFLR